MIVFQKRYFDSNDDSKDPAINKQKRNEKFKRKINTFQAKNIPNPDNKNSDDVEVYNINATPRMLKRLMNKVRI